MANTARGKAECYISIKAECQVLYFLYSTWQGNDLSVIKNFLNIHLPPLSIPSLPTLSINYWTKPGFVCSIYCLIQCWKGWEKSFENLPVLCHTCIQFYKRIIQHCSHLMVLYEQHSTIFTFDPPTQNSLFIYIYIYL